MPLVLFVPNFSKKATNSWTCFTFGLDSSSLQDDLYKPSFAGFVDVDLSDRKLSIRSLVHTEFEQFPSNLLTKFKN